MMGGVMADQRLKEEFRCCGYCKSLLSHRDLLMELASSEPIIIYNNLLRWAIFQLDRTLLEEFEGAKGSDIPVTERSKLIGKIRKAK